MGYLIRYEVSSFYYGFHKLTVRVHRDQGKFHQVVYDPGVVQNVLSARSLEKHERLRIFDFLKNSFRSLDNLIHFNSLQDQDAVTFLYKFVRLIQYRLFFVWNLRTKFLLISFLVAQIRFVWPG